MDLVCSRVRKVSPAGLGKKKELVRPAESEKTEEIREKEVPCGSERGKRDRETREVSEGGEKMQKILIVVDMQNDFTMERLEHRRRSPLFQRWSRKSASFREK